MDCLLAVTTIEPSARKAAAATRNPVARIGEGKVIGVIPFQVRTATAPTIARPISGSFPHYCGSTIKNFR
ncbi:MAG: hypothetical protein ABIQ51_25915 [Mesorhizobium sp.]